MMPCASAVTCGMGWCDMVRAALCFVLPAVSCPCMDTLLTTYWAFVMMPCASAVTCGTVWVMTRRHGCPLLHSPSSFLPLQPLLAQSCQKFSSQAAGKRLLTCQTCHMHTHIFLSVTWVFLRQAPALNRHAYHKTGCVIIRMRNDPSKSTVPAVPTCVARVSLLHGHSRQTDIVQLLSMHRHDSHFTTAALCAFYLCIGTAVARTI